MINTCNPIWSQSFVYSGIRTTDLLHRVLEVTIWDYDRFGANEFLGEVTIDLSGIARASAAGITLENLEATWHQLSMTHGNANAGVGVRANGRNDVPVQCGQSRWICKILFFKQMPTLKSNNLDYLSSLTLLSP